MRGYSQHGDMHTPTEVYVLVRVWDIREPKPRFDMFPDPHHLFSKGKLTIVSDVEARISDPPAVGAAVCIG